MQKNKEKISMLINLGRITQAIALGNSMIKKGSESSYLYYLMGKSYLLTNNKLSGEKHLKMAIELDPNNMEAVELLKSLDQN